MFKTYQQEKIEAWLISLKATILRNAKTKEGTYKLTSSEYIYIIVISRQFNLKD